MSAQPSIRADEHLVEQPDEQPDADRAPEFAADLIRLTDEELVLLGAEHPVVVLPYYEGLDRAARHYTVSTALRSLHARGCEKGEKRDELYVPTDLSDLLDVRASASEVLIVRRRFDPAAAPDAARTLGTDAHAVVETARYVHRFEDLALIEDVDAEGMHMFGVAALADLGPVLQSFTTELDVKGHLRDRHGQPIGLDYDLAELAAGRGDVTLSAMGQVLLSLDATVWRRGPRGNPLLLGVLLGSTGGWQTRNALGSTGPVRLEPIKLARVGETVAALLE